LEGISKMAITQWEVFERYAVQTEIVRQSLAHPEHSLQNLINLMRSTGEAAVYFSGTRLDSDYCFGSEEVGLVLSVLPEDGLKAAQPGYHPGSMEVYVTFQGSLTMEYLDEGEVIVTEVKPNIALILPPGQCHRVCNNGTEAASVVVKTNLRHQPGVVRCGVCEYFTRPEDCALYQSWNRERNA
jgi:mannose-6-phosphate isomerase-like protein (cupin superfamily)